MYPTTPISPLKVGVFYDGNFLLHASNYYNYIHQKHSRLSLSGLHQFVTQMVSQQEGIANVQITQSHYFRGRVSAAEALQRGNQLYNDRVFEDILMAEGVQTHYLPLHNNQGRKEERGIDVWLGLEVLEQVLTRKIDFAVLVISDTDYVPLLRKLLAHGVKTMLLSWEFNYTNVDGVTVVTKTSHELLQLATYPVPMHQIIESGLESGDQMIEDIFVSSDVSIMQVFDDEEDECDPEQGEIMTLKNNYGFIKYPNNNLFFHSQDVVGDFGNLNVGDPVEFVIGKNHLRQDVAKSVRLIS